MASVQTIYQLDNIISICFLLFFFYLVLFCFVLSCSVLFCSVFFFFFFFLFFACVIIIIFFSSLACYSWCEYKQERTRETTWLRCYCVIHAENSMSLSIFLGKLFFCPSPSYVLSSLWFNSFWILFWRLEIVAILLLRFLLRSSVECI